MAVERQAGHTVSGHDEQLALPVPDPVARHRLDPPQPGVAVLDEGQAERDVHLRHGELGDLPG